MIKEFLPHKLFKKVRPKNLRLNFFLFYGFYFFNRKVNMVRFCFFNGFCMMPEPYKIKAVESIDLISRSEREKSIEEANYCVFRLKSKENLFPQSSQT